MSKKTNLYDRVIAVLASNTLFKVILALLVLQAAWIAVSGRYPMAFDEEFHLGLIRLYAEHWLPFWGGQPASADAFGAITRDPSYLYHWLMSFPYQVIRLITDNQTAQVMTLRFINIGLFAATIPIYRRLLLKSGASVALVQAALLIFVLIPIVPLLAAQINYDNLWIPLAGLILLLTASFVEQIKLTQQINTERLLLIIILSLLASLIKYAFLPIFVAIIAYLVFVHVRSGVSWGVCFNGIARGADAIKRRTRWLLIVLLILSAGLFAERYGLNLLRYHKPVADCAQVLSESRCEAYGPWARDNYLAKHKSPDTVTNPQSFAFEWLYGMWFRLFFAVDGPSTQYQTRGPLLLPGLGAIIFASVGLLATVLAIRRVFARYDATILGLLVSVTVLYVVALIVDGYEAYTRTGVPVALNGRYLLVVLPFAFLLAGLSVSQLINRRLKLWLFLAAFICMVWGGGAMTYILRSNQAWYWQNSPAASINTAIQDIIGPAIPGYNSPRLFAR